jgi:uncharacterized coiled-coil DUF342 family protein
LTPQEIQQSIEGLLSVQRGLQETQLNHEERLERLETNSSTVIQAIGLLSERTERVADAVERMTDVQMQTFRVIEEMQADIRQMQADVREMQQEVRGLQTENRRILDRVFGVEGSGN